ncbi:hypothetical protein [Micromonospora sp. NPDC005205]|uniref:hypothetical protein n=1 Tax=Micromonospora sp. NPDC005205 TaxID=3156714 RepID=UPI0033ADEE53
MERFLTGLRGNLAPASIIKVHAFATFLLDQGEELRTVMELLGHSTIRTNGCTRDRDQPRKCWWSPGDSNP